MSNTDTSELLHRERLDARGNPTGYALCDNGDGSFPGGLLAHNSGLANCEACEDWEPDDTDGYETDDEEGPEPADGGHGTCAVCGGGIRYQACPTGGWWIHDTHPADGHDAQLGVPA